MANKHAYLILAHSHFDQLKMLCQMLDHPNHDIYLHIDQAATDFDPEPIVKVLRHSALRCTERTRTVWGAYSLVNGELLLLKTALASGEYSYFHLLSGFDMPLKPAQDIYDFFESCKNKEFIYRNTEGIGWHRSVRERTRYYYFFREKVGKKKNIFRVLDKLSITVQRLVGIDRTRRLNTKYYLGSQWFSITRELAAYIAEQESWIRKQFRYTNCPDEVFLLMLIENTAFMDRLYDSAGTMGFQGSMRFIDWRRGKPYTFREDDLDALLNSGRMFARKFDLSRDPALCQAIFRHITR